MEKEWQEKWNARHIGKGDYLLTPKCTKKLQAQWNTKKFPLFATPEDITLSPWFMVSQNTLLLVLGRLKKYHNQMWIPVAIAAESTPLWVKKEDALTCKYLAQQRVLRAQTIKGQHIQYEQLKIGMLCQCPVGVATIVSWDDTRLPSPSHQARVEIETLNKKQWYWLTQVTTF